MHSSMQTWHIAMHASSIDIIAAGVMPCMRSIARIIVLHMSAQFMQAGAHDIIWVEQTVQACSHAEHASIQACMSDMSIESMPGIDIMSFDIMSIIIESTSDPFLSSRTANAARVERYSALSAASRSAAERPPEVHALVT